jgi:hypothetical protein
MIDVIQFKDALNPRIDFEVSPETLHLASANIHLDSLSESQRTKIQELDVRLQEALKITLEQARRLVETTAAEVAALAGV